MPVVVGDMTVEPATPEPARDDARERERRVEETPAAFAAKVDRALRTRAERCERVRAD